MFERKEMNMARKGREFELENAWIYELDSKKYKVTSPAKIFDKAAEEEREVDVLIEYKENGILRRIGIECRDRKRNQDVTWIEQVLQKKEDLELDYYIATVSSGFTKGAINKARYHGVILEKVEALNSTIEEISKEFFADIYLVKYVAEKIEFLDDKGNIGSLHDVLKKINIIKGTEFIKELNMVILENCNAMELLQEGKIERDNFFENVDNSIYVEGRLTFDKVDVSRGIIDDLGIRCMKYKIKILPFRISLPLNHSVSVLNGIDKSHKKYRAYFGTEEENIDTGYIEDEIHLKVNLKKRKYFGFIGMDTHLNTIFPDETGELNVDWQALYDIIPEIDFSKLYE